MSNFTTLVNGHMVTVYYYGTVITSVTAVGGTQSIWDSLNDRQKERLNSELKEVLSKRERNLG